MRCGFDIITVSRACVYRSAPVYGGTHTERTPGELSTHTHMHTLTHTLRAAVTVVLSMVLNPT